MENFANPFSPSQIDLITTALTHAQEHGFTTIAELLDVCKQEQLRTQSGSTLPTRRYQINTITCNECGAVTRLMHVNISKCTRIGGGYKTAIECTDEHCLHTIFSKKSINELVTVK